MRRRSADAPPRTHSLHQLDAYGAAFPGGSVGLRFNPGLGSGGTGKTNVGGPDSSFGIWHELLPQVQALVAKHKLKVRCVALTSEKACHRPSMRI